MKILPKRYQTTINRRDGLKITMSYLEWLGRTFWPKHDIRLNGVKVYR